MAAPLASSPVSPGDLIAFQGERGAFSHLACRAVFPEQDVLPCLDFALAMAAVRDGEARYGMIPVENSSAGRVADVHDLIPDAGLVFLGEHFDIIRHHLLAVPEAALADIKVARSHVQALAQCRETLGRMGILAEVVADTAGAAAEVARSGDRSVAAIASSLAGDLYGLASLSGDMADRPDNTTRFIVMGRPPMLFPPLGAATITSLLLYLGKVPAALHKALGAFAAEEIPVIRLESYTGGTRFVPSLFYIEIMAHPEEARFARASQGLRGCCDEVRLLGAYRTDRDPGGL